MRNSFNKLLLCNRIRETAAIVSPVTLKDIAYISWLLSGMIWLMYGSSYPPERRISTWRRVLIFPLFSLLLRVIIEVKKLFNRCVDKIWLQLKSLARSGNAAKTRTDDSDSSKDAVQNKPVIRKGISDRIAYYLGELSKALFRIIYLNIADCPKTSAEITGFIYSTDKEDPMIRVCLLLRCQGFYGSCIEILMKRLDSGLPVNQTLYYLAMFLDEIGDVS